MVAPVPIKIAGQQEHPFFIDQLMAESVHLSVGQMHEGDGPRLGPHPGKEGRMPLKKIIQDRQVGGDNIPVAPATNTIATRQRATIFILTFPPESCFTSTPVSLLKQRQYQDNPFRASFMGTRLLR